MGNISINDVPLSLSVNDTDAFLGTTGSDDMTRRFSFDKIKAASVNASTSAMSSTITGINNNIDNIETYIDYDNHYKTNSNLYSVLSTLAPHLGYTLTPTEDSQTSTWTIDVTPNTANYYRSEDQAGMWANLATQLFPNSISYDSTSGKYIGNFNSTTSMTGPSPYIAAFKSNIFDNAWTANKSYAVGAIVVNTSDNKIYKCKTANNDSSFTPAKWDEITGGSGGGGGIGDTPQEQWRNLFTAILNGLTRALDIHYGWEMEGSREYVSPGRWDLYSNQYGYYQDASAVPYWGYYNYTDESFLNDDTLKFRGKILEVLKGMAEAYIALGTEIRSNTTSNNNFGESVYSRYVFNNFSPNHHNVYNAYTDVMYGLFKAMAPKVVKGTFLANDWTSEEIGTDENYNSIYIYKCKLSNVVNPSGINPFAYDANTEKPSGFPTFPGGLGDTYQPLDMIMDLDESISAANNEVYTASIDYFTRISNLREAYSKIFLTNIADIADSKDDSSMPDSWQDITAYTAVGIQPPSINIPVKFLVFPFPYNLADFQ